MAVYGETRTVWLFVMFDLPTGDYEQKREYMFFRKFLISDGFMMMQYSVYTRHCASDENMQVHKKRVRYHIPKMGEVRAFTLTDTQFGKMELLLGSVSKQRKFTVPQQITLL